MIAYYARKLAVLVALLAAGALAACTEKSNPPISKGPSKTNGAPTSDSLATTGTRPAHWAKPLEREGLPNLHQVSKDLYRGAQPTAAGMRELEEMGVKTVVNLRSFHSDGDELKGTNLSYEHIYMKAWHPEEKELVRFLKIVNDKERTPVFVHCQHGADRTGTMCALYRVALQGWTVDDAILEMREGGYNFHEVWQNLLKYLKKMDLEDIKRQAGIKAPTQQTGVEKKASGENE